jgi:CheY-like chemotaxis protein
MRNAIGTTSEEITVEHHSTRKQSPNTPVLVCVDDDPGVINAIELRLRPYDVTFFGCFSGMQGIWRAVTERPDLVITDLRMPQGDGSDLLECLQRNPQTANIPVLVLSGLRDDHLSTQVRNRGAKALLQKPIAGDQLLIEMGKWITLRKSKANSVS